MPCRTCFLLFCSLLAAAPAAAQPYDAERPRRHFVTVSTAWLFTEPLHFAEHPLADLAGSAVASAQAEAFDYRTRDGATTIDVLEFTRRQRGVALSVYPLGMSRGPAVVLRGSYEQLPRIRITFDGPAPVSRYDLTGARAYDAAAGLVVADRAPGWGLGSHAFVVGGLGRIRSDLGDGRRVFAEAGGGLGVGPLGVELGVKFAWNRLDEPVEHRFLTIPLTLRGSLTF